MTRLRTRSVVVAMVAIAGIAVLTLQGCATNGAGAGPSSSATTTPAATTPAATPTPSPTPPRVELTATSVAGVAIGASATGLEQALRTAFGKPTQVKDISFGCPFGGTSEPRRKLTWGGLTVWLAHPGPSVMLRKWEIQPGTLPAGLVLPYGVSTSTTVAHAVATIPGAHHSWLDPFQMYLIQTDTAPDMAWSGSKQSGSGKITYITSLLELCD
jgi:hypothetical protein